MEETYECTNFSQEEKFMVLSLSSEWLRWCSCFYKIYEVCWHTKNSTLLIHTAIIGYDRQPMFEMQSARCPPMHERIAGALLHDSHLRKACEDELIRPEDAVGHLFRHEDERERITKTWKATEAMAIITDRKRNGRKASKLWSLYFFTTDVHSAFSVILNESISHRCQIIRQDFYFQWARVVGLAETIHRVLFVVLAYSWALQSSIFENFPPSDERAWGKRSLWSAPGRCRLWYLSK